MINGYCNQPLRATIDCETLYGPGDFRFTMRGPIARLLLSRNPVTSIVGGQVSTVFGQPTPIPASAFRIEKPVLGVYGTTSPGSSGDGGAAVLLAPGYASWWAGRMGLQVDVTTGNGWPHAILTADATTGDTQLQIDDCSGWGPPAGMTSGAAGTIHDPGKQENATCTTASTTTGPGTLTLASALTYDHIAGTLITTMPGTILQAGILFAASQALVRGAASTTIQAAPGGASGGRSPEELASEAELLIHPFRRII
jgi:hypothetical protein